MSKRKFKIKSFKLYVTNTLHVRVNVHPTLRCAAKHVSQWTSWGKHTRGMCSSAKIYKRGKLTPFIAEINLTKNYCGTEVVFHELQHALFAIKRRLKLHDEKEKNGSVSKDEEKLCLIFGRMTKQMIEKLYKYEIWIKSPEIKN